MAVGVAHLGDADDVAEDLHASGFDFGGCGFDVIDTEAEHDSVVEAIGGEWLESPARLRIGRVAHDPHEAEEALPRLVVKPAVSSGFSEADEGTRTLDLLHGKDRARTDRR